MHVVHSTKKGSADLTLPFLIINEQRVRRSVLKDLCHSSLLRMLLQHVSYLFHQLLRTDIEGGSLVMFLRLHVKDRDTFLVYGRSTRLPAHKRDN